MILYHYTCDHGWAGILDADGIIRPFMMGDALVWLTDLPEPDRRALGLTSFFVHCDRTRHRFAVDSDQPGIQPWTDWCHGRRLPRLVRERYEGVAGAKPLHWWVSEQPVLGVSAEVH